MIARGSDLFDVASPLDLTGPDRQARTGVGRAVSELVGATVVSALVSLGVQWLLSRWQVPMPSFAPMALSTALSGVLILAIFALSVRGRFSVLAHILSWVAISTLATSVLSLMLVGT